MKAVLCPRSRFTGFTPPRQFLRRSDVHVEDTTIRRAKVENRRAPVNTAVSSKDRFSRLRHSGVHRIVIRQGLVKTARHRDRRFITHFELHRDYRGNAFENKTLGHARERIASRSPCAFAGIENHQAHRRISYEYTELSAR